MAKPISVQSTDTFATWRTRYNLLKDLAVEKVTSPSSNPPSNSTGYEDGTLWTRQDTNTAWILVETHASAAVWVQLGATPGALKDDGTVPLAANWPTGDFQIQFGKTTGAPFTVNAGATGVVTNLNADKVDGNDASALLDRSNHTGTQAVGTITGLGSLATLSSVANSNLADMAAWTLKIRNAGTTGVPSDVKISGLVEEATPAAGDWVLGEASTGELRKMDVGNLVPGNNSITNAKLSDMAAYTLKLRNAGTTGDPQDVKVSALTEETVPWKGDWLLLEESGGTLRKVNAMALQLVNDYTVKTANFTAAAGRRYYVDTDTSNAVTVTCPTPNAGDQFEVVHVGLGNLELTAEQLDIEPTASYRVNGAGLGVNFRIRNNKSATRFIYVDATRGWVASQDQGSISTRDFWEGTQAAYDLLTPDSNTIYFITN